MLALVHKTSTNCMLATHLFSCIATHFQEVLISVGLDHASQGLIHFLSCRALLRYATQMTELDTAIGWEVKAHRSPATPSNWSAAVQCVEDEHHYSQCTVRLLVFRIVLTPMSVCGKDTVTL
jgi:hypothetical protein